MPKFTVRPIYALIGMTVLASAAGAAGVVYYTQRLSAALRNTESKSRQLADATLAMQQQLKAGQEEAARLQALNASLTIDRDNLLAQTVLVRTDVDRVAKERELLEQVLRSRSEELRELRAQLDPMQEERDQTRQERDQLREERDQMKERLEVALKNADQTQLKTSLDKVGQDYKRAAAELKTVKQERDALKKREQQSVDQLTKARAKYDQLNERYTKIMAENTSMKHQVKKVPANVARLAQQHQRLVKETADMHYNLGVLLTKNQQYYQAASEFRKVLELRPDDGEAHYNLGVIYAEHLPDREKAVVHFRRYLEIHPRAQDAGWVKQYIASWQAWEAKERLE
jgi:chromosome segregation ATPase